MVPPVDQTMPALVQAQAPARDAAYTPLGHLGAGPEGSAMLARRGEQLVEVHSLGFSAGSPRWQQLEARVREIGAVDHPAVRGVLALDRDPPRLVIEADSYPPLAEMIAQPSVDLRRALGILGELARALATAHRVGVFHGRLHPWSVWIGNGDRPRIELTRVATRDLRAPWVTRCQAPELSGLPVAAAIVGFAEAREPGDAAADVYAIGALLELFATTAERASPDTTDDLDALIRDATAADPDARPTMMQVVRAINALLANGRASVPGDAPPPRPAIGVQIGRYELVRQLGAGAMGEVWEAADTTGGPSVAIKLLRPEIAHDEELLRRFRREARVLAQVGSDYIANFIDLNEDRGVHYLVLELVAGGTVGAALARQQRLPERLALAIIADACRGLAEPHRLGIVHRDLKPDNMMFVRAGVELETNVSGPLIKLGDFGIAREQVVPVEDATRVGAVIGTPEYMAPEQCQGALVTPATDVYALGCCLHKLISGRPPFTGEPMDVILHQLRDLPPRLDAVVAETSPAVADLVASCLAKDPAQRPADAAELLTAIDQLCNGTAALITAHPAPPIVNPSAVRSYELVCDLETSAERLWPFVSNTERMNRAAGLAAVRFEIEAGSPGRSVTTGNQRIAGLALRWREHPYEWIEGSRHVVLRVFERGVLRWYIADVTLERLPGGGTRVRNKITLEPRNLIARIAARWEIGFKYRRRLDRVYRRLDRVLATGDHPELDPIEPEVVLSDAVRGRIDAGCAALHAEGLDPRAIDSLGALLTAGSEQDVARIRPRELASRFAVPEDAMIDVCLHAAKGGMLVMVWDVICPSCRIPSTMLESLAKIEEHARCAACNLGFDVDFSRAIELAFRASPELRPVESRTFCIGGPAHFPHVVAQVRLAPGERFALPLALASGFYLLRSPQIARARELRVTATGGVRRFDVVLGERGEVATLAAGDQLLTIANPEAAEVVVRIERAGDRAYALSAARAMTTAAFRKLFPEQQLAPGRLLSVAQTTLVVAQIDDAGALFRALGDEQAFPLAARFFDQVSELANAHGGALVKTFGGLAIAAFERPGPAVDVALAIQAAVDTDPRTHGLACRIAVHRGPMMALTQGGRLDYFGQHVEHAIAAAAATPPAVVALTEAVCEDPLVVDRMPPADERLGMREVAGMWALQLAAPRAPASALPAPQDKVATVIERSR